MKKYNFDLINLSNIKDPFIRISFIFLEKYFFGCANQHERIKKEKAKMEGYAKKYNSNWQIELRKLFLDIHFYLICWANIKKILRKLGKIIKDENFQEVLIKYNSRLNEYIEFRTYLEHLIEGLRNKKKRRLLKNPSDIGNLNGDFFTFGGKKLYVGEKNLEILNSLYNDLNGWLEKIDY